MYKIGLSGHKQSGKNTVADCITQLLKGRKVVQIAFADALKEEVSKATGYSIEHMNKLKPVFRPLWQWWGTEFRRGLFNDVYWIDRWEDKITSLPADTEYLITTDVRFPNEAAAIRKNGGLLFRVRRPGYNGDGHLSETSLTDINYNYDGWIDNDDTLVELKAEINRLLRLHGIR